MAEALVVRVPFVLPEGWAVMHVSVSAPFWVDIGRPDQMSARLVHASGVEVEVDFRADQPDWAWIVEYLVLVARMPAFVRRADAYRPSW